LLPAISVEKGATAAAFTADAAAARRGATSSAATMRDARLRENIP
jgi:hypothetical protein